jgi:hypothetical protein
MGVDSYKTCTSGRNMSIGSGSYRQQHRFRVCQRAGQSCTSWAFAVAAVDSNDFSSGPINQDGIAIRQRTNVFAGGRCPLT